VEHTRALQAVGYHVIEKWECEDQKVREVLPKQEMRTYLNALFYDFESFHNKEQRNKVSTLLKCENAHVPILVSIGNTIKCEPTHICSGNPKQLIRKFMEELERCGRNIRAVVRVEFMAEDIDLVPGKQQRATVEWCDQVPVLGFNCGHYDLNLIKEHFAELLADATTNVQVGKKANTMMFMKTNGFHFVDIINYLRPRTRHEKWVKAYNCSAQKSGFPYE